MEVGVGVWIGIGRSLYEWFSSGSFRIIFNVYWDFQVEISYLHIFLPTFSYMMLNSHLS